ncbi:MAG TPA: phosphatase PAP2 family protein [Beijerinckiaceae bacterium]|jgi:membrane-associated phospholipid phosphatase
MVPTDRAGSSTVAAVERADVDIAARLARHRHHPGVRLVGRLSEVGDQPPLAALSCGVMAYGLVAGNGRATRAGVAMLGSLLAAILVKTVLKRSLSRTRPHVLLEEGQYEVRPFGPNKGSWQSFPSGHTAGSVACARAFARFYPDLRAPAYASAAFIGLAQVPRGAHYPLDVAVGVGIGLAAERLVHAVMPARDPDAATPEA